MPRARRLARRLGLHARDACWTRPERASTRRGHDRAARGARRADPGAAAAARGAAADPVSRRRALLLRPPERAAAARLFLPARAPPDGSGDAVGLYAAATKASACSKSRRPDDVLAVRPAHEHPRRLRPKQLHLPMQMRPPC